LSGENFFASVETDRLYLDDDQKFYVELRRELDYGEETELQGAVIRGQVRPGQPVQDLEFDFRKHQTLLMAFYIDDWNLPGPSGKPVSLPDQLEARRTVVSKLSPRHAAKVMARIQMLRAVDGAVSQLDLKEVEGAESDPTGPGDVSASATPSTSSDGLVAAPIEMSSVRPIAS
jgi:hypothetical protein